MLDGLPDPLHVRLPSDLAFVRPFRKMLEGLLAGQSWPEDAIEDAALVATEVVQNAIEHGSRADGHEAVTVLLWPTPEGLDLEVTDPGTGKDPQEVLRRDVTVPPDLTSPRGRGLFLIHTLSARFDRVLAPGGGCLIRVHLEPESA